MGTMASSAVSPEFCELVAAEDDAVDLARAALQVARIEYPNVDVDAYLRRIEDMATAVSRRLGSGASAEETLRAINRYLFGELRFSGNAQDYYDPRNSYLNEVLERRVGIPITLSIIYLEIGWRLGLPLAGVSFPGHFLVKLAVDEGEIVIDPYARGLSLGHDDLEQRILGLQPSGRLPAAIDVAQYLEAASRKEILHRVLRNLRSIHLNCGDDGKLLSVLEHMLCVRPGDLETMRDRGLAYARLGCFGLTVEDLTYYVAERPDAEDLDEVRARLVEAQSALRRLH
ncbi:MAG: SirB1 family protein [Chromatiales bacterium]